MRRSIAFILSPLLVLGVVSCGGSDSVVAPPAPVPVFTADRTTPAARDIYVVGQVVDSRTLLLKVYCNYLGYASDGPPYSFTGVLNVPVAALEPTANTRGPGWPAFQTISPTNAGIYAGPTPDDFNVWANINTGCAAAGCPATWSDGPMHMSTVTVQIKQSGTHRITWTGGTVRLRVCENPCGNSGVDYDLPAYGGTLVVP